jgi:hypothetical protein
LCDSRLPNPDKEFLGQGPNRFDLFLGVHRNFPAACTIGPTMSSSPHCGNLPSLCRSLSDGISVMALPFRVAFFNFAWSLVEFSERFLTIRL